MSRELDIIDALRDKLLLAPDAETLLDELEELVKKDVLWPQPVREAAAEVFGGGVHNPRSRVHGSLDRRIRHALKVWRQRYGLNAEQLIYAGDLLAWCIRIGAKGASTDEQKYKFVLGRLGAVVNKEEVHAGMQRRAGYVAVDVGKLLSGIGDET